MNERKQSLRNEIIRLALPMALQQFMTALVGACDAIMLGKLSQNAMSAVSLATQVTFVFNLFMYAFVTGENMFVAQYYGKGDYKGISKIFSLVTKACGVVAVIFLIGTFFFPRQIMAVLTNEEELITLGSEYLRVIGISYLLSSIAQTFLAIMKNCNAVNVSTLINSVMVILNIILNAVFIFGLFGCPEMGIRGAALATVLATVVQVVWSVGYVLGRIQSVKLNLHRCEREITSHFWQKAIPLLINNLAWGIGFSMYSVVMGHLGTDAVAANRNRKYFQEPDRMLLSWTGKCRKHHRRKPSRSKPPGRGKRSRRTSDKNCDHRRNPVRSGSDHSVSIYHPNGRPDSDSLWIFTENATDLFLLHSRKISQLHDYWRHLCSRWRLKVWNAV